MHLFGLLSHHIISLLRMTSESVLEYESMPELSNTDTVQLIESNVSNGCNGNVVMDRIRRPPNAFMLFGKQHRKLLATKYPQYTNKQISKILGEQWKSMSADNKAHYHRLADETHRQHLNKYPGYYYSPLEARIRKAERKRNSKSMRKSRKNMQINHNDNTITLYGQINSQPMIGSNGMIGNAMFNHPMPYMRARLPSFPNIRYYGPQHPFGGFVPHIRKIEPSLQPPMQPSMHVYVMPINREHNYSAVTQQQQQQRIAPENPNNSVNRNNIIESNANSGKTGNSDEYANYANTAPDLSAIMSQYLPPMLNHSIHVTPVSETDSNQNSSKPIDNSLNDSDLTDVCMDIDLELEHSVQKQLFADNTDSDKSIIDSNPKVIVKREPVLDANDYYRQQISFQNNFD